MAFTLDALQQVRLKNMAKVFSLLPGDKVLLVDSSLLSALDRVTNMAVLRKLSVTKLFKVDNLPPKGDFPRIAYLLPSTYASVMLISKHCKVDETNGIQRTRLVVFVPKETPDVRYVLESKGLYGRNMCTESLSLGWIPIDSDLVSLNLPTLFADFYLNGDYTWPQFMGLEVGELLEVAHESELAPMGCRVHAFGEAAEAVASGIRLHCIQSGLVTAPYTSAQTGSRTPHVKKMDSTNVASQSSMCSVIPTNVLQPPPLVIIFSRGTLNVATCVFKCYLTPPIFIVCIVPISEPIVINLANLHSAQSIAFPSLWTVTTTTVLFQQSMCCPVFITLMHT
ncbi:hypothetical protein AHF37_01935 [Paragonimus kellicotti]|nr:hypothetical protein AHF37_01935 [Paragonimus kellicotti]